MSDNSWKMPDWMKPLERHFVDKGALSVEALMNTYGSKCAGRLVMANTQEAAPDGLDLHALIVNAQVGLLVSLKAAGCLVEPKS